MMIILTATIMGITITKVVNKANTPMRMTIMMKIVMRIVITTDVDVGAAMMIMLIV